MRLVQCRAILNQSITYPPVDFISELLITKYVAKFKFNRQVNLEKVEIWYKVKRTILTTSKYVVTR